MFTHALKIMHGHKEAVWPKQKSVSSKTQETRANTLTFEDRVEHQTDAT